MSTTPNPALKRRAPYLYVMRSNMRNIEIPSMKSLVAWNLPVGFLYIEYFMSYSKLLLMQNGGFYFALYDNKTKVAVQVVEWFYGNLWVFGVALVMLNAINVLAPKQKPHVYYKWVVLIVVYVVVAYIDASYFFYIESKVITS